MSDKQIKKFGAVGGKRTAYRNTAKPDYAGNDVFVPMVEKISRPAVFPGDADTPLRSVTAYTDETTLDPLPSAVANSLVDVSEAEHVIVYGFFHANASSYSSTLFGSVTPLIMTDDATPQVAAVLPPMIMTEVYADASTIHLFTIGASSIGNPRPLLMHYCPTFGAKKMGFALVWTGVGSSEQLKVYVVPTSGVVGNSGIEKRAYTDLNFGSGIN